MRLIDADKIMESPVWLVAGSAIDPYEQGYMDGLDAAETAIKEAPPSPPDNLVKRGQWIVKKLDDFRKYQVTCSECGWIGIENYDSYNEPSDFNFCPNCGADMREGNKNEQKY